MKTFVTFILFAAVNATTLFSTAVHADTQEQMNRCQQTFHDYLEIYRDKQLQQRALQLYFSNSCMPYSHLDMPESTPQTIPSLNRPGHFKLLERQDAAEHISTYQA